MATTPVSQAGLQGLRDAIARADEAASRIASGAAGDPAQLTGALVDMQQAKQQAAASARVVEAGERALGTLIDVLA
jgi:hypothetical protein